MPSFTLEVLGIAHKHSLNNKDEISTSQNCACFHCFRTYSPNEIEYYIEENDGKETALCPYCLCDTVIGDASGIVISDELLDELAHTYLRGLTREEMKDTKPTQIVILD